MPTSVDRVTLSMHSLVTSHSGHPQQALPHIASGAASLRVETATSDNHQSQHAPSTTNGCTCSTAFWSQHHAAASLSKPALRRMKGTTSIVGSFLARIILLPRIALGCQPVRKTYTEHLSRILIQSLRSLKQSSRTHAHNLHGS